MFILLVFTLVVSKWKLIVDAIMNNFAFITYLYPSSANSNSLSSS